MSLETVLALGVALLTLGYLAYSMLRPERF
jgi:K+-transporting ATPase KdpF subunit